MRFLHLADVHLGSKMESRLPSAKAAERRRELLSAFSSAVDYARGCGIDAIVISGDLFDSDRPFKKDKEFFFGIVGSNPDVTFYYLRGNHDIKESFVGDKLENLKTFTDSWTSYRHGDAVITGIELTPGNEDSLYNTLTLNKSDKNIVMLHGDAHDGAPVGADRIDLRRLKGKGIDYLALGHIHSHSLGRLDERGIYAYPGCLEGRGFDECGEKGFLAVDTDETDPSRAVRFIKSSIREIKEISVDVSEAKNSYEIYSLVKKQANTPAKDLLRVNLVGNLSFSGEKPAETVEKYLSDSFYFVSVKDKTKVSIDISSLEGEISLRGEFLRLISSSNLSDEDKREIITLGLCALSGEEIDVVG